MLRGLCLALAMVGVAAATPSAAQPFDTFKRFCLETGGVPESAVSALNQAGWETDPRAANLPADSSVTVMSDPATGPPPSEMVMVGIIASPTGLSMPVCSVMGPAVEAELEEQVTGWAGFAPARSAQGGTSWIYSGGPDQVTPQLDLVDADDAKLQAAARSRGTIHAIQVRTARAGPFLFLSSVVPEATTLPTH